jgi:hypothetical protein
VNFAIASTDVLRTTGTVVKDILRTQDLTNTRSGSIAFLKRTPSIEFFHLPAKIRNQMYRYCLVVGNVYPRSKSEEDYRLNDRSGFQKHQTQVFQLCRQIFEEAAPLYFAENKFVLSYDELPWSADTRSHEVKPISRIAHQNLRSLSITFDLRDAHFLPSDLLPGRGDHAVETFVYGECKEIANMLRHLKLQLLEVSLENCYCAFCHRRMITTATECLIRGLMMSSAQVIIRGLINSDEVLTIRNMVDSAAAAIPFQFRRWYPEYDGEDPDDKLQIAFRVVSK